MARRERRHEHWVMNHWRPIMGWQYMATCLFDFIIAPVMIGIYCAVTKTPMIIWHPITLEGGGLYHISMGAIVGITAFGRTKEKISNDALPDFPTTAQNSPTIAEDPER